MEWLRLWHDMPNDPKWRTIARLSGQPITLVQAMYLHLLVDASRNVTRGHVTVTKEDIASALDVTDEQVESVFSAMQGRVLDGDCVTGWSKRQPKREDTGSSESGAKSASQRKREQREREKLAKENPESHDESHDVTESHDREDKRREEKKDQEPHVDDAVTSPCPYQKILDLYHSGLPELPAVVLLNDTRKKHLQARWRESPVHQDLQFWADYFFQVKQSRFLLGQSEGRNGGKPFRATFDWLIAPSNFVKVIEGNYNA